MAKRGASPKPCVWQAVVWCTGEPRPGMVKVLYGKADGGRMQSVGQKELTLVPKVPCLNTQGHSNPTCLWHANQCPPCQPPCKILDHMRVLSWSCEVRFFRYHDQRPFGAKKMHPVMLGVLHVAPTDPSSYQNPLYRTYR